MKQLLVAVLVSGSACVTLTPVTLVEASPKDATALHTAAEAFYSASTVEQLRAAVDDASRAGPDTALFHELAATFAQLEGRDADVLLHWVAALQDTTDDQPLLHLHSLMSLDFTFAERTLVRETMKALVASHPNPDVRAAAAFQLASLLTAEGDFEGRTAAVAAITNRVPLAWVGTWDNDQGKGYDLELAPELRPDLDQKYDGRVGSLTWRGVPTDPRGRYDLAQLMTPTRWAVAFGQGPLTAPADGTYLLKLTTSDPLKVWVDGRQVFAAPQLERSVLDQLVIPLTLKAGTHRFFVKSAHREGSWFFLARFEPGTSTGGPVHDVEHALMSRLPQHAGQPARAMAQLVNWSHLAVGGVTSVKLADSFARVLPKSLVARVWLIDALWFNQERGRTADLLSALDTEVGDALPFIRLRQTRFHQQQGLKQRARERLLELTTHKPWLHDAWDQLADLWRNEGWTEDEIAVITSRRARFGASADDLLDLGRAAQRLGKRAEAIELYEQVLDELPFHAEALRRLAELAMEAGDLGAAQKRLQARLDSWPTDTWTLLQLAEARRRAGDPTGARLALDRAEKLSPESAVPPERRGALAYEAGDTATAVKEWKRAVELSPENEALANRVDYLAPEARGPWMADVPDEASLAALVKQRDTLKQVSGADVAYLLDHEVTQLATDGSTTNVITLVAHAWNSQGRDRLIRQSVGQGRLRVLQAYSVDERGQRSEASSERNKQIFFRGMQPGSTLVMQYRLDAPPHGYLARHHTETWTFQGIGEQRLRSAYVLWAPGDTRLHEAVVGHLDRTEDKRGEQLRVQWSANDVPPLVGEPSMPTVGELALTLRLSTVPDWRTWLSWEQALLEGAFRDSPELDAVARKLGKGDPSADEKLKRVHTFVMEEIRYQQDYETFIAGVKPHPAPMVLERRYGDCKDKAVLFIELAKKLGVDAQFALVRTRDTGTTQPEVPMQQFNHAIVYVPEQPGVAARFFDPTAELLDVDSMRSDDVGTRSLVFDPKTGEHTWRDIPWQSPDFNREVTQVELELDEKGGATGTLTLDAVGRSGSVLRRTARNAEVLKQASQRIASLFVPNATASDPRAVEAEDLRVPARLRMNVSSGTFARPEGETLRIKLPTDANPRSTFTLATRKYPLVLGVPQLAQMEVSLTLPRGWEARKLPQASSVSLPCLTLSREVSVTGRVVKSVQRYRTTCERVSVEEYPAYRAKLDDMVRLLDDELVLGPEKKGGKPQPKAGVVDRSR
jgi:tetratricopeptide (TPR) repeat protein